MTDRFWSRCLFPHFFRLLGSPWSWTALILMMIVCTTPSCTSRTWFQIEWSTTVPIFECILAHLSSQLLFFCPCEIVCFPHAERRCVGWSRRRRPESVVLMLTSVSRGPHHALPFRCMATSRTIAAIDCIHVSGVSLASLWMIWLLVCRRLSWHWRLTEIGGSFRLTEEKVLVRVPSDL